MIWAWNLKCSMGGRRPRQLFGAWSRAVGETDPLLAPLKTVLDAPTVRKLTTLGLHTIDDLIRHYPRNYIDVRQLSDLALLPLGDQVSVVLDVVSAQVRQNRSGAGSRLEVTAADGDRTVAVVLCGMRRGRVRGQ